MVYQQNLAMVPGAAGTVTLNFCDNASTSGVLNFFDSHSRLQTILNKTGSNAVGDSTKMSAWGRALLCCNKTAWPATAFRMVSARRGRSRHH